MRFLSFCLLLLLTVTCAQAQNAAASATWTTDLTTAMQQAKATNKPVLAIFSGSDWCKPCIMLKEEVFDKPEFGQFAKDKFVLARFDFPRARKNKLPAAQTKVNEQAAAQFNKEGAFPLVVLISPEGKVLAKTGYRPGGVAAYDAYLTQLLAKR
ncbi:thioredoxin family protein [Hymenobacter sp. BT683]|uniref:Thioredoxin family protein n=1 Tax=Hymenobacter jeongseonensis TaxID=2791027 RepID=A0ABS0IPF3_9BACT|nr:thioredoxin family protein [Hymenobacter jeongseonensis]MBF9239944.1 thioredoxin family protein [Hymenobacter jeongseonensis]